MCVNILTGSATLLLQREAQLSQRGRIMLHVIKYFAKSLKITQGHWKWHHFIRVSMAFHSNYGHILHHFRDKARFWSKISIFAARCYASAARAVMRCHLSLCLSVCQCVTFVHSVDTNKHKFKKNFHCRVATSF